MEGRIGEVGIEIKESW